MSETLTQPNQPPREDDDEPCGLTKGQIRGLCEPRLPWDFLKQNPSLYSMLVGAVNAREQDLDTATLGQEQLVLICDALDVEHVDIAKRATEALKKVRGCLQQLTEFKQRKADFVVTSMLLKTVESAIGSRGTTHAGIAVSTDEITTLLSLGQRIVAWVREQQRCLWCSSMRAGHGHDSGCPVGYYEAIPKHGDVKTYQMKSLWESKRLSRAFQLSAATDVSIGGGQCAPANAGDWVVTPDQGFYEPIIMSDAVFRSMFELAP